MVRFGDEDTLGYVPPPFPIACLSLSLPDKKFAEPLSHRDCLGALLNLGIKRELLGDILICENVGYLVAMESIASYLEENLTRVRHTAVRTARIPAMPEGVERLLEERTVVAASSRLDALIGAVWNLSRSEAKELVEKERVSIRGKLISDPSFSVKEGDRVSVRGCGRFYFDGETGETRSGRCRMRIRLFV
jgi:RNA-binding protein YlmH